MTPVAPATWTDDDRARWARIAAHDFEPATDGLTFTGRLARDHGWSLETARHAVEEYRRFCFLALRDGAAVTPSQEVDEVWHQHLTFSRDYWLVWCKTVLRAPLHHDPTRGGPAEGRRFVARYTATLALYEEWFGPPPADFWPGTAERFGSGPRFRIVDRATHLVIPAPRSVLSPARRCARALGFAVLFVLPPTGQASASTFGSLDWTAGPFLVLYILAATLSLLLASRLPLLLTPAAASLPTRAIWEPAELGLLAGGRQRAADVLALQAIDSGDAVVEGSRIVIGARQVTRAALLQELSGTLDALQERLAAEGLAMSIRQERQANLVAIGSVLPVMGLGAAKILVGEARDKPVGLLTFLLAATLIAALVLAFARRPASRAGRRALRSFKAEHPRLLRAPRTDEVFAAFACVGVGALFGTALEPYGALLKASNEAAGCGSSGCGSGGCGGAGCGGCGGGD